MYQESRQPAFKLVTPKECERFLAINNFPGQKPYNPIKGKRYADNMASGSQRRVEIAVCRVIANNTEYLVNGQHCANAVVLYGRPYQAVISYYTADTMEDAWRLFATFDVHATRTERQFIGARRGIFNDERLREMPLRILQCCGTALYALNDGTEPKFASIAANSKTEKADALEKYADDVVFASRWQSEGPFLVVPVVAAIIATGRKNREKAIEFWDKVVTGDMLAKDDPRKKLRDKLLSGDFSNMRGRERNDHIYKTCIAYWNSWRNGTTRNGVKTSAMKSIPAVFA